MRELFPSVPVLILLAMVGCSGPGASTLQVRPVDEGARSSALASIGARANELAAGGKDAVAQRQALAEYARTLPDVAYASPSVDGVVGLFYDAQPFIVLNNVTAGEGRSSSSTLRQPDGRAPFNLPSGKTARLLNGFPPDWPDKDPGPELDAILSKKGYVPLSGAGTIDNFKTVSGEAVLHIRTHGGGGEVLDADGKPVQDVDASGKPKVDASGKPVLATLFGLWTTDLADAATIAKYKDDVGARRLVRMYEVTYPCKFDFCTKRDWHLGITVDFIAKHWGALARGAYIHVSACSTAGSGLGNQVLVDTIMNKSSGAVYVGWNNPALVADMDRVATYFIDRLTGANVLDTLVDPKEDPPQRPFDLKSVGDAAGKRKMLSSKGAALQVIPDTGVNVDEFVLAPSIATVESWDREGELHLKGLFGDDDSKAKITVGSSSCAIKKPWSRKHVMCTLDRSASGEVLVTVDNRESNRVKLSSWRGKLTYQVDSTTPGLSQVWTLDLHLRGDVGDYRDQAGEKPVAHKKIITMAKDSKASVVASGSATDSDCTIAWAAQKFELEMWGTPALLGPGKFLALTGIVDDGDPGNLWFELVGRADPCYDRSVTAPKGGCSAVSSVGNCLLPYGKDLLTTKVADPFHVGLMGRLAMPAALGPDGSIAKGQTSPAEAGCCGGELTVPWDYTQRVSWDSMSPEGGTAPDPKKDER